jgi:hypothetical protein
MGSDRRGGLASASSRSRTPIPAPFSFVTNENGKKVRFGATPKPARQRRALPRDWLAVLELLYSFGLIDPMSLVFKTIQTEGIAELSYLVGDDEGVAAGFDLTIDLDVQW